MRQLQVVGQRLAFQAPQARARKVPEHDRGEQPVVFQTPHRQQYSDQHEGKRGERTHSGMRGQPLSYWQAVEPEAAKYPFELLSSGFSPPTLLTTQSFIESYGL